MNPKSSQQNLTRYAWLSIAAAIATMALKGGAAILTGSVGLASDAMESSVNLVAAIVALLALRAVAKAPDEEFAYGREKAEYLSAGVEGTMIVLAAVSIVYVAVNRLINPGELTKIGVGLAISMGATAINLLVALVLIQAGNRFRSITLEADGKHLMTDVWTSLGVLVAIGLVTATGWAWLDPIIAIGVALNIVVSGYTLVRRSVRGLLDASIPEDELHKIEEILDRFSGVDVQFHELRTRQAGRRAFASVHVLVPGSRTVTEAHDLAERIESELSAAVPDLSVITHIEPFEDPRSYADEGFNRRQLPESAYWRDSSSD
jgi:cation diffusion facilitator family transporter